MASLCSKSYAITVVNNTPVPLEWFKMEEAAGDRLSVITGGGISPAGNVARENPGKVNFGVEIGPSVFLTDRLIGGLTANLGYAAGAAVAMHGWINPNAPGLQIGLQYSTAASFFMCTFDFSAGTVTGLFSDPTNFVNMTTACPTSGSGYFFFCFQYNPATQKLSMTINGGAPVLSAGTAALVSMASALIFINPFTGAMTGVDELAFYNQTLDAAQLAALYNGGAGVTYPY